MKNMSSEDMSDCPDFWIFLLIEIVNQYFSEDEENSDNSDYYNSENIS